MKTVITILVVLVVLALAGVLVAYSGMYNISTYNHDNALVNRLLDTAMTRSVQFHARGVSPPRCPA